MELIVLAFTAIWDIAKPFLVGAFIVATFVWIMKYLVLDEIGSMIDDSTRHLKDIQRNIERITDSLYDIQNNSNELKGFEKHTTARELLDKVDHLQSELERINSQLSK
jgi:hypothetical protein